MAILSWKSVGIITMMLIFGVTSKSVDKSLSAAELLVGEWVNDLGSVMMIDPSDDVTISGQYKTIVGAGEIKFVPLIGFVNPKNEDNPTFVFGIQWEDIGADSCTGFVGQYYKTDEGEELRTKWLLRRAKDRQNDWQATLVGENIFKKKP